MLQAPSTTLQMIPSGAAGTRKTLSVMRHLVLAGKKSPVVRQLAVSLTKGLIQKDWNSEVNTLYSFVRDRIRYVRDINGVETLHTPEKILENAAGDCDDKSILLASLLESLGYKTRLVAIGFRKNTFSHVYPEVLQDNVWLTLETTEPVNIGWKPRNIVTSLILNNSVDSAPPILHGLGKFKIKPLKKIFGVQKKKSKAIAREITELQKQPSTPENEARISQLMKDLGERTKRSKKEMKKFSIIATIVTIVVGIFTFGAGGVAVQGAFQAVKAGAIEIAKKILLAAATSAALKGANSKDVKKAKQAANDLEIYPPDPNLTSLDAMLLDSQAKKQVSLEKTTAVLVPAGIIAAITLLT